MSSSKSRPLVPDLLKSEVVLCRNLFSVGLCNSPTINKPTTELTVSLTACKRVGQLDFARNVKCSQDVFDSLNVYLQKVRLGSDGERVIISSQENPDQ